ncbi:hypothetical protein AX17_000727 [Amanita inopinata Kibby_2008]|nr:hypothetical protein AX17_000727 [Amanita inopinata Kibby_2008]
MVKRDIEESDVAAAAEGSRPKRRKEGAGALPDVDTSMADVSAVGDEGGGQTGSMKTETVKEQGLRLWQIVKDAVNKEGRTLSIAFLKKPAKRQYPDYYQVISQPIALDDIKKQLDNNAYQTLEAVRSDFELCFTNAKTYNVKESEIWRDAKDLLKLVNKTYQKMVPLDEDAENADGETGKKGKSKPPNMNRMIKSRLQKLVGKADDTGRILSTEFMELPSRKEWPIYYKEIKRPQCLENIFKHIKRKEYPSTAEFAADVELVFSNALTFNQEHTPIWEDARILRDYFRQLMSDLPLPFALSQYSKPLPTKIKIKSQVTQSPTTATLPADAQPPGPQATSSPSLLLRVPAAGSSSATAKPPAQLATASSATSAATVLRASTPMLQPAPSTHPQVKASSSTPQPVAQPTVQTTPQVMTGYAHYPSHAVGTPTIPGSSAPTTQKSSGVSQSQSPTPSAVSNHQLKYVSLHLQPLDRKMCLDYRDGVKSWAMRLLPGETGVHIDEVVFLHDEEEESSGEEDVEQDQKHEEEEEEVAEDVPVKNGRRKGKGKGRGRPLKTPVKAVVPKTKVAGAVSKKKVFKVGEVQVKLNGVMIKGEEDKEGEWTVSLPVGSSVLQIGEAGGAVWKVYAERLAAA